MKLTVYKDKDFYEKDYQGIYSINFDNGKRYIGMSNNIRKRLLAHCRAINDVNDTLPVHKAMRIHNFEFELLEDCSGMTREELCERERYWIELYQTYKDKNKGYNLTPGGDGAALGCDNTSASLTNEELQAVYNDLIYNTNLYIYQIAAKYDISPEAISDINNGRRYYNDSFNYPLRKPPKPKVGKGTNNHLAKFKDQKIIESIYKDLEESKLTLHEIASKYNCSYLVISQINRGISYTTEGKEYPIRKQGQKNIILTSKQIEEIRNLLISTEESQISIAKRYGVSKDVIRRINTGNIEIYRDSKYTYPIRANKEINKAVSTILASEE